MTDELLVVLIVAVIGAFAAAWWTICWFILREYRRWRDEKLPRDSRWEIYTREEGELARAEVRLSGDVATDVLLDELRAMMVYAEEEDGE